MAKRKNKRSFGASIEEHETEANRHYETFSSEISRANTAIDAGRCDRALSAIGAANEASGALAAHLHSAGGNSNVSMADLGDAINSTEQNFRQRCVKEAVIDRNTGRVALGKK